MPKILFFYYVWLFFVSFSLAQEHARQYVIIDKGAGDGINLYYSFGTGGPLRQRKEFYAGETVAAFLELPHKFSLENKFNIECKFFLVFESESNVPRDDVITIDLVGNLPKQRYSFTNCVGYKIPYHIKTGEYEFQIEIYDRLNNVRTMKKDIIRILEFSEFGIRDLSLWHGILGTQSWVPGSGYFVAGESAKICLNVAGLKINDEGTVNACANIALINEEGLSIDLLDGKSHLHQSVHKDFFKGRGFSTLLPLTQPGNYRLNISVQDLNAEKTSSYTIPVVVKSPSVVPFQEFCVPVPFQEFCVPVPVQEICEPAPVQEFGVPPTTEKTD